MRGRGAFKEGDKRAKRYRNLVTQCLGGIGDRFNTSRGHPITLLPRDILLLCSDGLWSQIPEEQLIAQMRHHGSLKRMADELAHSAELAGTPASDNVTLVALRWSGDPEPRPETPDPARSAMDRRPDAEEEQLRDAIEHLRSAIEDFESDH